MNKLFSGMSILFVEDEEMVQQSFKRIMERHVEHYYAAVDGVDGLETFRRHRPDVVITDINMPNMDGLEMSGEIKEMQKDTYIMVLSAFNDKEHLHRAIEVGIDEYLQKPLNTKKLKERLGKVYARLMLKKEAEHSHKLQKEYKKAVDASAIMTIADRKGIITYANDKVCEISGYTREELLGSQHSILRHPDMDSDVFNNLWATIKEGEIWKGKIKNRKKDGSAYYVDTTIVPVLDEHGAILEYLGLRYDITALVENEKALQVALERAKGADKAKSEFLANMSHEIRTPLNGVIGFIDLMQDQELGEKPREYAKIIDTSAKHLLQVINDILDISKVESGKLEIENEVFDLRGNLENTISLFQAKAKERGVVLQQVIDEHIPSRLKGDSTRITQVMSNLLSNAIKFTPDGGRVNVGALIKKHSANRCSIEFFVSDTGIGIPEEKQQTVFEPFSQADGSITRQFGGTGLGLSISKKLVGMMGAELGLKSKEGSGSRFFFTIPFTVVSHKEEGASAAGTKSERRRYKGSVLVADDNPINIKLLEALLEEYGISMTPAKDGEEAYGLYIRNRYDLILADLYMPKLDGIGLLKKIKQIDKNATPVVSISANAFQGGIDALFEAGFDDVLSKPIARGELERVLAKYLKEAQGASPKEEAIDSIAEELGIKRDVAEMLIEEFLKSTEEEIAQLREKEDREALLACAHSIKGAALNIRLRDIGEIALEVENFIKNGSEATGINSKIAALEKALDAYRA